MKVLIIITVFAIIVVALVGFFVIRSYIDISKDIATEKEIEAAFKKMQRERLKSQFIEIEKEYI